MFQVRSAANLDFATEGVSHADGRVVILFYGSGFRVQGLRAEGLGFEVWVLGLGLRVWVLKLRVEC